jgi:hypothetical protein
MCITALLKRAQTGAWWLVPVIPANWRLIQGDWIFEASLHYIAGDFKKKKTHKKQLKMDVTQMYINPCIVCTQGTACLSKRKEVFLETQRHYA